MVLVGYLFVTKTFMTNETLVKRSTVHISNFVEFKDERLNPNEFGKRRLYLTVSGKRVHDPKDYWVEPAMSGHKLYVESEPVSRDGNKKDFHFQLKFPTGPNGRLVNIGEEFIVTVNIQVGSVGSEILNFYAFRANDDVVVYRYVTHRSEPNEPLPEKIEVGRLSVDQWNNQ